MKRILSGTPVPRHQVFVLDDGNPVVQLAETRVQELYTGRVRLFTYAQFGHPVTDYELDQLKALRLVEAYTRQYVWLYSLPEQGQFSTLRTLDSTSQRGSERSYYLNTTLPAEELDAIAALLSEHALDDRFTVVEYDGLVAILGAQGMAYRSVADADMAQRVLAGISPRFEHTVVAFVEMPAAATDIEATILDLQSLIDSQSASPVTEGRRALVVCRNDEERQQIRNALETMHMQIEGAATGMDALRLLEDSAAAACPPDVLVLDVHLDDMHGWELLSRMREIQTPEPIPVVALADDANEAMPALSVSSVQVAPLQRPLNIALLRERVYEVLAFRHHHP